MFWLELNSFLPHTLTLFCVLVTVLSSINITTPCNSSELANEEDKKIYLILMLPFSETTTDTTTMETVAPRSLTQSASAYDDGHDIAPAAYAAVQEINKRSDLLEGYTLDLVRSDGGCNIIERTVVGFAREVFHSDLPLLGMVGPWCSDSSKTVAQLTSYEDGVSLVSLHFGTIASLGDRTKYRNMYGMLGSTELWTGAYVELMKHNSWTNVAILFSETNAYLIERAYQLKIAIQEANALTETPDYSLHTFPVFETFFPINDIKKAFTRVIFVFTAPRLSSQLLCVAYHEGLKYPYYQFVFADRQESEFGETRLFYDGKHYHCSNEEMQTALRGHLNFFFSFNSEQLTDTGLSYEQFVSKYDDTIEWYREHFNVSSNSTCWASPAYDAVWALSLALNNSLDELRERNLSLLEATKGNRQKITNVVQKNIVHVDFQGVSGHIQFDSNETRFVDRKLNLFQYSVNQPPTKVGCYESGNLTIDFNLTDTENSLEPIFISSTFVKRTTQFSLRVAVPILVLTILIVFIGLPFHLINIFYRNRDVIKATSSLLNHLIFTGGYIIVFGIVILTLSNTLELSYNTQITLCNISPFLTSIGLTLILGTVCLRTWRLYEIFVKWNKTHQFSSILLQDYTLLVFVLLLALVDVFVCVLWSTIDTQKPVNTTTIVTMKNEPLPIAVKNTYCHSKNDTWWRAAIILHKCVILAFSLFFAYLTRKVKNKDFQTQNITLLVYAFAVIFGIGFPTYVITGIVSEDEAVHFFIYCAFLDIAVCTSFLFLFLSPVLKLYGKQDYIS